eukprot:CAMPEP_0205806162 /NCGR_PEP_ID=MMETSP0205-20121125/9599_1 /ASSEMBLY_ACC=CAM_ASM_000278 /TAXON_ID=36767 /ORGANISM="Euplotes focardii, Strain TN1" /LENGTH=218 /DNA_ID=CAMNT_0053078531 /DNA_START=283 /DNA_END=935 /DNA_ORIENTATION=+
MKNYKQKIEDRLKKDAQLEEEKVNRAIQQLREENSQKDTQLEQLNEEQEMKEEENKDLTINNNELKEELKKQKEETKEILQNKVGELNELEEVLEEQKRQIKDLHLEKESKDEEYKAEILNLSQQNIISYIYKTTIGSEIELNQNFRLDMDINDQKDRAFIEELVKCKLRLPNIKEVSFRNCKDNDDILNNFFEYNFPTQIQNLAFNWNTFTSHIKMG